MSAAQPQYISVSYTHLDVYKRQPEACSHAHAEESAMDSVTACASASIAVLPGSSTCVSQNESASGRCVFSLTCRRKTLTFCLAAMRESVLAVWVPQAKLPESEPSVQRYTRVSSACGSIASKIRSCTLVKSEKPAR